MPIRYVKSAEDISHIHTLLIEYAQSLNFSLCFQNFEKELNELPGEYAEPTGTMLLAFDHDKLAGCVALRRINDNECEMKRLYVRPQYRGQGLGRKLAEVIISEAKNKGYSRILLDTVPSMNEAINLYTGLGFERVESYRHNPIEGAVYMALNLKELSKSDNRDGMYELY